MDAVVNGPLGLVVVRLVETSEIAKGKENTVFVVNSERVVEFINALNQ